MEPVVVVVAEGERRLVLREDEEEGARPREKVE